MCTIFQPEKEAKALKFLEIVKATPQPNYTTIKINNPEKASSYILKNFWNEEITEINKNI